MMKNEMKKHGRRAMMLWLACLMAAQALFGFAPALAEDGAALPEVTELGVIHELEFGGVYITMSIEELNARGFAFGDSVTVAFSNGYTLEDIPYYNGYYTRNGDPLLIGYPGYDYIKACINNGDDLWVKAGLDESCTARIALKEKGKYLDIQEARNLHYEDDRSLFESDVVFANFRNFHVGNIREGLLYRSASPCDNQHNRAAYSDALIADAGVRFILNLADTDEKMKGYIAREGFNSPYFLSLYQEGKVHPLAMNMNFGSDEFRGKAVEGLRAMLNNEGPYLIHCTEGKDRTGFMCMLVEALCGASYEEIVDDYMITYNNYYGITKESEPKKYETIVRDVLEPMIRVLTEDDPDVDLKTADLAEYARGFLKKAGMSEDEITRLTEKLTK